MTKILQKGDDLKMVMIVFEELTHELMLPFSPGNSALIFLILISQSCQNGLAGQVVQGGQSGQSGSGGQGGQGGSGGPGCPGGQCGWRGHVVRVVSLDDIQSENIWLKFSKP